MGWVRIEDKFPENVKVSALSSAAKWFHVEALCYASRNLTDGFVPAHIAKRLGWSKYAKSLVAAGVWEVVEGGWQIHDYLDYNPSKQEIEQKAKQKAEAGRKGGQQKASNALAGASGSASDSLEADAKQNSSPIPSLPIEIDLAREWPEAPSLYGALANAGIQRTPERWVESWLDRGRTADHIRDAIGRMREAGASNTRYLDAILERETTKPVRSKPVQGSNGGRPSWMEPVDEARLAKMRVVG